MRNDRPTSPKSRKPCLDSCILTNASDFHPFPASRQQQHIHCSFFLICSVQIWQILSAIYLLEISQFPCFDRSVNSKTPYLCIMSATSPPNSFGASGGSKKAVHVKVCAPPNQAHHILVRNRVSLLLVFWSRSPAYDQVMRLKLLQQRAPVIATAALEAFVLRSRF